MPTRRLLTALACALLAPAIWAQTDPAQTQQPLTAETLAAWALEANPGLVSAAAAAEAAALRIEPAGSLDDPMLSYAAAPGTADSRRGLQQKLDISQKIPWPGTLAAREAAARFEADAAQRDLDALRLEVIAQAKSAHAEWRFIDAALQIHRDTLALLDELVKTSQTRYAAGRASRQDALQARVERAGLDKHLYLLLRQRTATRARINALLNRAPDAPLPDAAPIPFVAEPPPALENLEERALVGHPELARLQAQIAAQESRVTLAEKAFYPDLQFGAGYNDLWDAQDKRTTVGVSINLPLDRGKRRSQLEGARARQLSAEWSLAERRAQLLADLARVRAEVEEAQASVTLYEEQLLPLANDYLKSAIADYRSGSGAFLNVITAEQHLLDTELDHARALADYARRLAELERWTGGELGK